MSYSISFTPKSKKARTQALEFAKKHFKPWSKLIGLKDDYASELLEGKNLSYDHHKFRLGFNYGALDPPEREYIYTLLRFLAIRVGKLISTPLGNKILYYIYDGEENTAIWESEHDKNGLAISNNRVNELTLRFLRYGYPKSLDIIRKEVERLAEIWERENR
jgi:hypothetical protein